MVLKINYPDSYEGKMHLPSRKIGGDGYSLSLTELEDITDKYSNDMQRRIANIGDELYKRAVCRFVLAKMEGKV